MQTARDKIRELRALHEDGLLSQQEFDSRKNAILDAEYAPPGSSATPMAPAIYINKGTEIGLMAGQEIGPQNRRYRLERLIAQGGMGQVWQATDLATHAELGHSAMVAVKILSPVLTQSPTHAKLLIEEATQARRLAHEHIVRVYEWAQDPATASYFIIMECLEGEDLDSLLAREGTLALARVQQLLAPVGEALKYAWDKHKLVHRDLKPANVFVTTKGEIKLLDFGIAARARSSASSIGLEAPGNSGTAGYRAPEAGTLQRQPGQRLDVYAVAVMIYQMVEGRMPFDGLRSERHEPPRPAALDERQWGVLQAGFAWDPERRPPSVPALLAALDKGVAPVSARAAPNQVEVQAREQQRAAQLAAKRQAEAQAQLLKEQQRREQEAAERRALEVAKQERKDALRQQLHERRAADAEKARLAKEAENRKLLQARAAAAYRSEQERARAEQAARNVAELEALMPTASSPVADNEGVLRDRFLDGSGKAPELVLIPTGRFEMGSNTLERTKAMEAGAQKSWVERELPQHWVGIDQPIAMGRFPVTVGEWRQFVQATGWRPRGDVNWASPGFRQTESHPVVGVSWNDARQYVVWLSAQTGQVYRLPSEAEWEYACRAGTRTAFSFGDRIDTAQANYDGNTSYNGSPKGLFRAGTSRVGEFPANPWGLFDMHGNVWEWVQDVVHDNYDGAPADGSAWEQGGDPSRRILRGGSWMYNPYYLRSALRNGFAATLSNDIVGFRVARDLI
jgi:formylglycine-generating enzyme required for sulfatase activity